MSEYCLYIRNYKHLTFEVITVVNNVNCSCWGYDMYSCVGGYQYFRGTYCFFS
jgi:hypothetical protein